MCYCHLPKTTLMLSSDKAMVIVPTTFNMRMGWSEVVCGRWDRLVILLMEKLSTKKEMGALVWRQVNFMFVCPKCQKRMEISDAGPCCFYFFPKWCDLGRLDLPVQSHGCSCFTTDVRKFNPVSERTEMYAGSWSDLDTFLSRCLHTQVVALGLTCLDKLKWW